MDGGSPVTTGFVNKWVPLGNAKMAAISPSEDIDNTPPDNTSHVIPIFADPADSNALNFI